MIALLLWWEVLDRESGGLGDLGQRPLRVRRPMETWCCTTRATYAVCSFSAATLQRVKNNQERGEVILCQSLHVLKLLRDRYEIQEHGAQQAPR